MIATNGEIRPLTTVRMLAALMVFGFHFYGIGLGTRLDTSTLNVFDTLALIGYTGVNVFFVLSGFLITLRYYDRFNSGDINLFDYFRKRIARIWPLYFVVLGLTYALRGEPLFTWPNIASWTLTQGYFADLANNGIVIGWSLTVEESFYILAPLILLSIPFLLQRTPLKNLPKWPATFLTLIGWSVFLYAFGRVLVSVAFRIGLSEPAGFMANVAHMQTVTIFGVFFNFAVGIACALIYLKLPVKAVWARKNGLTIATVLGVVSVAGFLALSHLMMGAAYFGTAGPNSLFYQQAVGIFVGAWFIALTHPRMFMSRIMSLPLLVYLGRVSYALYILQYTPIVLDPLGDLFNGDHYLYLPALYVGMTIIAAIFYEVVEKPGRKLVMRLTDPFATSKQAAKTKPETAPAD